MLSGSAVSLADRPAADASVPGRAVAAQFRYAHVDALRAIAALLVLWAHTAEIYATLGTGYVGAAGAVGVAVSGLWMNQLAHALDFGRIGVVTFFAISGFVVPFSLQGARREGLKRFGLARVFRLYPAYLLSVPLGIVSFYWIWQRPFSAFDFWANLTMVPQRLGAQPAVGVYWTLAVEWLFYGLCALLFWFGWLRRVRVLGTISAVLMALTICYLLFVVRRTSNNGMLLLHLSIMFYGALVRYYFESVRQSHPAPRLGAFLLAYAGAWAVLPVVAALLEAQGRLDVSVFLLARTYAIGVLIFCVGVTVARIRWRFAAWLGEISYSIYLLHPVALYGLLWCLLQWGPIGLYQLHLAVYVAAVALITILMAGASYHWLELPMIRLGKRLAHRDNANVARATHESFP